MERAEGRTIRTARGRALAVVLALAALVAGAPQALFAGHVAFDWSTVEAGGTCYSCHTLDYATGAGAAGTSYINPSARGGIYNLIKTANGGTTPTDLGCVFCHNNPSNVKMKGVLNHFLNAWASKHPVGYNWNTPYTNTDHEYVSSVDASSHVTTELDCTDCHEAASIAVGGSYVNHPGTIPAGNPYLLKSVTVDGEYDAFCRTCHRSDTTVNVAGKGTKTIQLASHADAATGRPIVEADGTVLKTGVIGNLNAQCTKCHDTHYSSKVRMFNDGHEGDAPIVGDNCLAVCHYPGDNIGYADDTTNNSYERHGHGRQTSTYKYRAGKVDFAAGSFKTVNMGCASCHNSLDTGTTDGTRVIHVDKNPTGANNTEKYVKRFNIGLTMQDEGGGSGGGNPILGVCENCHASYESHLAEGGNVTSGCQDCHDEHAENSGPTSNVFMIPLSSKPSGFYSTPTRPRTGSERVEYTQTAIDPGTGNMRASGDQYRADGMGVCDNTECHGTVSNATQPGPLSTFFSGGYHGTGGSQSSGTVCEVCHDHQSDTVSGSWSPDPAGCANCHDYPGIAPVGGAHALSSVHTKHTDLTTGKGFDCSVCHQNAQHNDGTTPGGAVGNGTEWAAKVDPNLNARVQVRFDTTWNPGVGANPAATSSDNTNYNDTSNVCSNTFCHALKGTAGDPGAQGSTPTPAWSGTLACGTCHADTTALTAGSHGAHLQTTTGAGAQCANCHTAYDLSVAGTHMDGSVNFNGAFTYAGAAGDKLPSTGRAGCGTNACHANGQLGAPRTAAYTWGTAINGTNSCTECHGDTSATLTTQAHDRHVGSGYVVCTDCHAAATVNTHGDGTITLAVTYSGGDVVPAVNGGTFGTCTTGSCHNATTNIAWDGTPTSCSQCHQTAAGSEDNWDGRNKTASTVVTGEYTGFGHGKSSAPPINRVCTDCHEISTVTAPHSFTTNLAGTNPYRLKAGFSCSVATLGAAACHSGTTQSEALAYSAIKTHSSVSMGAGSYAWSFLPECVNCHDPHGDGSNIKMIQNELYDKATFNLFAQPPAAPTEQTNLVFTDRTTGVGSAGTSWADSDAPRSSLCQECHEGSTASFADDTTAGVSPHNTATPLSCVGCHKHDTGFKGGGCDGCHGNGAGQMWPQNAGSSLSGYPDRNGRHLAHLDDIAVKRYSVANAAALSEAQQTEACGMCHNDPAGAGGSNHDTNTPGYAEVGNFAQFWGAYATTDVAPARSWTAPTYTSSTWNAGTATCVGVDCHNNQTTPTTWEWYGAATTSCLMCHTVGTTASAFANPISGHHDSAITTGMRHDNSFQYGVNGATLGTCATCHISGTSGPTTANGHINGAVDTSIAVADGADPRVYLAPTVGFADAVTPTCLANGALGQCHLEQWNTTPSSTWTRIWHEQGTNTDGQQCKGCHGTFATGWRTGVSPVHSSDWDGNNGIEVYDNHDNGAAPDNYNQCRICHTYNETAYFMGGETNNLGWARKVPASSTYHGDGKITMNGTFAYSTSAFNCGTNCHTNPDNTAHNLADSGWPVNFVNGPGLSCAGCHSGITTHMKLTKGGADVPCEACHPGGAGLPVQHSKNSSAYVTLIPNPTGTYPGILGIDYTGNGETGIYLGGYAMSGYGASTTEAEMCWRCHDSDNNGTLISANDISEWGTNTDTNSATYPNYNFGTLSSRNWIGATWASGTTTFGYKGGAIRSTHTANVGANAPTGTVDHGVANPDTAAQIRCSYCHDVHEMAKASGDTASGKPYLRGSWAGNPYKEDGAPQSGTVYSNWASWGSVPRASSSGGMNMGGYWIDQNSASPTTNAAFTTYGGLCDLCHGATKNGILDDDANDIDALNQFGSGTGGSMTEWASGWNGHRNSVKGGSGPGDATAARNIYNARGGTSVKANQAPYSHYAVLTACPDAGYGFRGPDGLNYSPQNGAQSCKFSPTSDQWGVDERGTATQTSYHNFPCSKCHNAHASRLPRLMITNCLDTKHNTWDDAYQVVSVGSLSRGRRLSNWQSAQNCHRLVGDGTADAGDSIGYSVTVNGWNKVTPW